MAKSSKWNIAKNGAPDNKREVPGDLSNAMKNWNPPNPATPTVSDGVETWEQRRRRMGIKE